MLPGLLEAVLVAVLLEAVLVAVVVVGAFALVAGPLAGGATVAETTSWVWVAARLALDQPAEEMPAWGTLVQWTLPQRMAELWAE